MRSPHWLATKVYEASSPETPGVLGKLRELVDEGAKAYWLHRWKLVSGAQNIWVGCIAFGVYLVLVIGHLSHGTCSHIGVCLAGNHFGGFDF